MIESFSLAAYSKAIVEFFPSDRDPFKVCTAPQGVTGDWPVGLETPLFVITAWNPGTNRPDEADNRILQEALLTDLAQRGYESWLAIGRDPDSPHFEESAAVSGLSEKEAIGLGATYRQDAIFAWTPAEWSILSCLDDSRYQAGWRFC